MKKTFLFIVIIFATYKMAKAQNVGIGTTTPHPSAQLDISNQPAAGNSSVEKTYSFADNNPVQKAFTALHNMILMAVCIIQTS